MGFLSQKSRVSPFRVSEKTNSNPPSIPIDLSGAYQSSTPTTTGSMRLTWSGGDDDEGGLVYYRVFFYVQYPLANGTYMPVTMTTTGEGDKKWAPKYSKRMMSYDWGNRWDGQAPKALGAKKRRNSPFYYVDCTGKSITIPGVFSVNRVYFYVQAINYCNDQLTSVSALEKITN